MEAHIVGHLDVSDGHLAAAVLVEHVVSHVDHGSSPGIHVTTDSSQKLIKGKLSVFVGVEVLDNLSDFDLAQVEAKVAHAVFEFLWIQRAVFVSIHGSEQNAEASESVCTSLTAKVDDFLLDLG